jgi:hypothetical protein
MYLSSDVFCTGGHHTQQQLQTVVTTIRTQQTQSHSTGEPTHTDSIRGRKTGSYVICLKPLTVKPFGISSMMLMTPNKCQGHSPKRTVAVSRQAKTWLRVRILPVACKSHSGPIHCIGQVTVTVTPPTCISEVHGSYLGRVTSFPEPLQANSTTSKVP